MSRRLPLLLVLLAPVASAGELVYQPTHPAFGGSPLNGSALLNEANAQNTFKDPSTASTRAKAKTPLEQFNEKLQQAVLNRIANAVSAGLFDANGDLQPGTVETSDFTITIVDPGDGTLQITTVDKQTGASSTFEILNPATAP